MRNDERPVAEGALPMVELWRGELLEGMHQGHAVICDADGEVVEAWGEPSAVVFPRSAYKMIQALPLVESGAAEAAGLSDRQLALACASHQGSAMHVHAVEDWLETLGLSEPDLRCGSHEPKDRDERDRLIRAWEEPCQLHNNCSGKHAGFLTLNRHLGGGAEYVEIDHPVQRAVKAAFEELTGRESAGWGVDGCSAPNFASTLSGLGHAMGLFAGASESGGVREKAMVRLRQAMASYPEMVAGEGRACTELMRAMDGKVAVKTGAEGVFIAIIPELGRGIALKIVDGATRASEAAITALLVRLGALDPDHPVVARYLGAPVKNCRGIDAARVVAAAGFPGA